MQRRDFLVQGSAAGVAGAAAIGAVGAVGSAGAAEAKPRAAAGTKFKLKYGPHPGMFENHVGADYLDQLKYAADQGFTGWEDNGMKGQSPEMQEKIGKTQVDRRERGRSGAGGGVPRGG